MEAPQEIRAVPQHFGDIDGPVLFRLHGSPRSFVFLGARLGRMIFHFPVLENGQISRHGSKQEVWPSCEIDILNPKDLGMGEEIRWAEEGP